MNRTIVVEDGDELAVFVRLGPSVSDPAAEYAASAKIFRVVSGMTSNRVPIIELVPVSDSMLINSTDFEHMQKRLTALSSNGQDASLSRK